MKKTIASVCAFALISASVPSFAKTMEFTIGSTDMYVSDYEDYSIRKNVLDCTPYTSNDRTLVPVRIISESFGAEVKWDEATQRVDISCDGTNIFLHIGSNTATVNGEEITLDVAPELTDSRTMVPLRFISEALGKRVEYVELTEQVIISDDDYAISVDDFNISIDDIRFYAMFEGLDITNPEQLNKQLPQLLSSLTGSIALSSEAKKAGVSPSANDFDILKNSIHHIKDLIYDSGALMAPGVKLLTDDLYKAEYLDSANMPADDENLKNLYNQDYIRVKHILLKSFDPQTAEYYDDEKKAELKEKSEGILAEIKNGVDFDSLHAQYNEDDESFFFPDGLTICQSEVISEFAEVAFALEEGEISKIVETRHGYHIIKRLPLVELDEKIFSEIKYSAMPSLAVQKANIVYHMTNDEIIDKIMK